MSSTPKANKYAEDIDNQGADRSGCGGTTPEPRSPLSRSVTPSSKSFRAANRIARRARSFKEDFLEKISQMRNTAAVPIGAATAASPTTSIIGGALAVVVDSNNRLGGSGRETPTLLDGADGTLIGDEMKSGIKMVFGSRGGSPTVKSGIGGGGGEQNVGLVHEFDLHKKQLQTALMYFRSSVANDKLEMLAGNGTIILDTVWAINLAVKSSCAVGLQSNTEISFRIKEATQAMYHNASRLIKVCDDVLLKQEDKVDEKKNDLKIEDEETRLKKKIYRESVEKVLATLEESVKSLLNIARDSLTLPSSLAQHNSHTHLYKTIKPTSTHGPNHHNRSITTSSQQQLPLLLRPPSPAPGASSQQRNSLPDIPLTPRERELLGEKRQQQIRSGSESGGDGLELGECVIDGRCAALGANNFSSESVLKDVVDDERKSGGGVDGMAPDKPPLPQSLALRSLLMSRCVSPPPLPPKKNKFGKYGFENIAYIDQISNNLERSSLRSRSPEDSISLLSASGGSLDSMLNHSREEEEIKSLMEHTDSDTVLENDISDALVASHHHTTVTSSSSHNSSSSHHVTHQVCGNRLSNTDSGVVSMHSIRNSSCSKRSSVASSSSNAIKHTDASNNETIVRTASVETDSSNHTSLRTYQQTTTTSHHHLTSSSSTSNSSSTVSMLSSSANNNHIQQQQQKQQHCMLHENYRMDSTATTTTTEDDDDEEDMFQFKHMDIDGGSVEFDDEVLVEYGGDRERGEDVPPALPQKMRKGEAKGRMPSPYDNVADGNPKSGEFIVTCQMHQSHQSLSSSVSMASISQDNGKPPPLPPKKKHMFQSVAYSVMAYMEMFGNCSHANDEFMRHSVHMTHGGNWAAPGQSVTMSSTQSCSFSSQNTYRSQSMAVHQMSMDSNPSLSSPSSTSSHIHTHHNHAPPISKSPLPHPFLVSTPISAIKSPLTSQQSIPPALPPRRLRTASTLATPPPSPPPSAPAIAHTLDMTPQKTITREIAEGNVSGMEQLQLNSMVDCSDMENDCGSVIGHGQISSQLPDLLEHTTSGAKQQQLQNPNVTSTGSASSGLEEKWRTDLMESTDIDDYLVLKKADEDMPDIRGGSIDALIIQASTATRNSDDKENGFSYQEAFLTTYRTFITPYELISKLIRRYYFFYRQTDKKKRFREAFALIVCVVNDLVSSDLVTLLHQMLMDFDQSLIADGELVLAKALRIKLLEKHDNKMQTKQILSNQNTTNNNALNMSPNVIGPSNKGSQTLLDFKSEQIAEQMTLLDAELFMRIEIPEVLIWVQEQKEETSPNLTRFTEHFNKMSYWARTRILLADARDRERYFVKFIKIMKQLRKINNFNSYLALLSALDSAPIRRLEWQKHVQDGLKEYCALIDSSSSFRAYRQALAETNPPCIPYIGLVLQDLTFVHIGNSNLLPSGAINFSKRWQQFHIVENMKRFKKCSYNFKRNDRIISYFQSFNDYINEDEMWNLSENIKPRGRKAVQ